MSSERIRCLGGPLDGKWAADCGPYLYSEGPINWHTGEVQRQRAYQKETFAWPGGLSQDYYVAVELHIEQVLATLQSGEKRR